MLSTSLAEAPGSEHCTVILGISTSGISETGISPDEIIPRTRIATTIIDTAIGRSISLRIITCSFYEFVP